MEKIGNWEVPAVHRLLKVWRVLLLSPFDCRHKLKPPHGLAIDGVSVCMLLTPALIYHTMFCWTFLSLSLSFSHSHSLNHGQANRTIGRHYTHHTLFFTNRYTHIHTYTHLHKHKKHRQEDFLRHEAPKMCLLSFSVGAPTGNYR